MSADYPSVSQIKLRRVYLQMQFVVKDLPEGIARAQELLYDTLNAMSDSDTLIDLIVTSDVYVGDPSEVSLPDDPPPRKV